MRLKKQLYIELGVQYRYIKYQQKDRSLKNMIANLTFFTCPNITKISARNPEMECILLVLQFEIILFRLRSFLLVFNVRTYIVHKLFSNKTQS